MRNQHACGVNESLRLNYKSISRKRMEFLTNGSNGELREGDLAQQRRSEDREGDEDEEFSP